MLATSNRLLPSGNRLPESKTLGKKKFFEKLFWKKIVLFNILKNSFNTYLNWVFSWFFTWILNLDWTTLWFLKLAWLLILELSLWHHQNNLGKHCFHNLPFFLWWQSWNQENTCKFCSIVHSSLSPPFFLNSCLNLELSKWYYVLDF